MNIHHGVKSQGGLSSTLNKAFSYHYRFKPEVWVLECWESWAAMNQGHDSELSIHPSKYPTADLQELHNLSLFVYESRRWQNYSSYLWLSVWPECRVPSYRISLSRGWTVYTNGQRAYHSLCFCYICGLAKWLQFKKAQHKPDLTNTGVGEMLYLYSRVLPWGVSSLTALPCWQSALSNKYLGSKQAAVSWTESRVTSSCTRADLGTTPEFLGES